MTNEEYEIICKIDFTNADLRAIDFSFSNFSNADFSHAKFEAADFSGADFSEANLSDANLHGCILNKVVTAKDTITHFLRDDVMDRLENLVNGGPYASQKAMKERMQEVITNS